MHKYISFPKAKREYYEKMLETVGSLSRLFSESDIPYLDSRVAENLYCKSFDAQNKSRDDSSVDAVYQKTGIGIKTFRGNSDQKIAEFNKALPLFARLKASAKAKKIAELRNERIELTKRKYGIDYVTYHCIRREKGKMILCEHPMDLIDIPRLRIVKGTDKYVKFKDGKNNYKFNISKSVLYKDFPRQNIISEINVNIIADPFDSLGKALGGAKKEVLKETGATHRYVILPLYATRKRGNHVPLKSGLNQWHAKGRPRDLDEVYIPIPAWIHHEFAGFFPKRDKKFTLKLPDGSTMSAKICQDGDKALMSDPNKALGQWILRHILQLRRGELLTYKRLQELGIDSVIVRKTGALQYSIDFKEQGAFEKFKEEKLVAE